MPSTLHTGLFKTWFHGNKIIVNKVQNFVEKKVRYQGTWASVAEGRGGRAPPWIFKHGTNIVDRGLKVLFFGLFSVFFPLFPPPWKIFCRRPCQGKTNNVPFMIKVQYILNR